MKMLGMTYRVLAILVIAGLMLVAFSSVVSAKEYEGDDSYRLEEGTYMQHFLSGLSSGDSIEIEVKVTDGGNIDVMLMDSYNFALFKTAVEEYDGSWENVALEKNTKKATISISAPDDGDYILVVDNTEQPEGGADPTGYVDVELTYETSSSSSGDGGGCLGVILIIGCIGTAGAIALIKRRVLKNRH